MLDELKQKATYRYLQVLRYFPKAKYDSFIQATGRSDGRFSRDGTGHMPLGEEWVRPNDYAWFRFVFLHEVGHCLGRNDEDDPYQSEETADTYALQVIRESDG